MLQLELSPEFNYSAPPLSNILVRQSPNKIVKLLEKNPLGMTLPEMAGGPRQLKKLRSLRPLLTEALRQSIIMPISQRSGYTVYRLVKYLGHR